MALTVPAPMSLKPIQQQPAPPINGMSLASRQALAILAVDGIRPSNAGVALMQSIDSGSMTRAEAIQTIVERARRYAKH